MENTEEEEKKELCKKIKSYGYSVITALNCKYDFCSAFARECIFDYVDKTLEGDKPEVGLTTETLEDFIETVEKFLALDNKQ